MRNIKNICRFILISFISICSQKAFASGNDTLKIFSYNTLNYGVAATPQCPGLLTFKKHVYLREILKYVRPDIVGFMKMDSSSSFATDTVPDKILDSVCYKCYSHGDVTNHTGYSKIDMLYFRNDKLGLVSTTTAYSGDDSISDLNIHKLYYKAADLATTHDTQFINVIVIHLLSGKINSASRTTEMLGVVKYLQDNFTSLGNFVVMGDFNSQSATEKCYQYLTSPSDTNFRFYDPGFLGKDWKNNLGLYANYLTQTTRIDTLTDCGSTGGMKDIYDHMLFTYSLMQGTDSVKYLPGSYRVFGQDGKHTGVALIDSPTNVSVPTNILKDLYYMSNHLPVEAKIVISKKASTTGIKQENFAINNISGRINSEGKLNIYVGEGSPVLNGKSSVVLYDMLGKVIYSSSLVLKTTNSMDIPSLSRGAYILNIVSDKGNSYRQKIMNSAY